MEFSICDINKNLIAIGSIDVLTDYSGIFIYDKSQKEIIWIDDKYDFDRKLLWKNGILYLKWENDRGSNFYYDTNKMNKNMTEFNKPDKSFDNPPECITLIVGKELNLQIFNSEKFLRKCLVKLESTFENYELKMLQESYPSFVKSITSNALKDKFVFVLNDERHILCEILNTNHN